MNYFDLINTRESCRAYSDEAVTKDEILTCIRAASLAPSACNSQPVRYVVIEKPEDKRELCVNLKERGFNKFVDNCAAFIAVIETTAMLFSPKSDVKCAPDQTFAQIDLGIATLQLCLAATEIGLGTCIMGGFTPSSVAKLIGLKEDEGKVRLVLAIGHPASKDIRKKQRNSVEDIVRFL